MLGTVEQVTGGRGESAVLVRVQSEPEPGEAGASTDGHLADLALGREVLDSPRQRQVQTKLSDPGAVAGNQHVVGVAGLDRWLQRFYHSE